MLGVLIVGLALLQTVYLDSRRVGLREIAAMQDSLMHTVRQELQRHEQLSAKRSQIQINTLQSAIEQNIAAPIDRIDERIRSIELTSEKNRKAEKAENVRLNFQLYRLGQIMAHSDTLYEGYHLIDRKRY
jgi:hypothetical protein